MRKLKEKIVSEAKVNGNIIKIDHFLNHQIDTLLLNEIGQEFANKFPDATKVLTLETSGIPYATSTAMNLNFIPTVYAKKIASEITSNESYMAKVYSFTKKAENIIRIDKDYLNEDDKVLIVDDFLANGEACKGLINLCDQANAEIVGIGIVVEKGFQLGRKVLESKGYIPYSLAVIKKVVGDKIIMEDLDG